MKIYNTLTKKIEEFKPIDPPKVGIYTCGPTVYDYTHIGHIFKYINDDLLKRVLRANGYQVKDVMNVTDVGHLTSDEDEGDDKLEKGARERNMSVWDVAKYFEKYFLESLRQVNVEPVDILARATDHIGEQVKLIQKLEENGYIYITDQAIYFDVSKFKDYGQLTGQKLEEKKTGARSDVITDPHKKNPADFALWFFTVGHFKDHEMRWPSPWGEGFPGWHIECSAMSMEYLGDQFDIHTGGIDHIPVHHTNEIAQSEAATGKKFVSYWVHHGWVLVNGVKMSKSLKNFYTIDDIKEKGFDPLALRYLFLTSKHRDNINFTWESLQAAQNALNNLREEVRFWPTLEEAENEAKGLPGKAKDDVGQFQQKFLESANNDINIPQAVAVMWEMVRSDTPTYSKAQDIVYMDKILGLGLEEYLGKQIVIPVNIQKLISERETARKDKDFEKSDKLRHEIKKLGYEIEDTSTNPKVKKIS